MDTFLHLVLVFSCLSSADFILSYDFNFPSLEMMSQNLKSLKNILLMNGDLLNLCPQIPKLTTLYTLNILFFFFTNIRCCHMEQKAKPQKPSRPNNW